MPARQVRRRDVAPDPEAVAEPGRRELARASRPRSPRSRRRARTRARSPPRAERTSTRRARPARDDPSGPAPPRRRRDPCADRPRAGTRRRSRPSAIASRNACSSSSRDSIAARSLMSNTSMRFRPRLLGPVLRGVGERQQRLGVVGRVEVRRDADARGHVDRATRRPGTARTNDCATRSAMTTRLAVAAQLVEQHRELVAAEAGEHVGGAQHAVHALARSATRSMSPVACPSESLTTLSRSTSK